MPRLVDAIASHNSALAAHAAFKESEKLQGARLKALGADTPEPKFDAYGRPLTPEPPPPPPQPPAAELALGRGEYHVEEPIVLSTALTIWPLQGHEPAEVRRTWWWWWCCCW